MENDQLVITWLGHSFVLLEYAGVKIAIDPHDGGSLNLPTYHAKADYLLITHDHYDHNAANLIELPSKNRIFKAKTGEFSLTRDIIVHGYKTYHDKAEGRLRGENIMYVIRAGPFKIVHAGDLGDIDKPEYVKELLTSVDLAIIPVGGVYTIDAYEAWNLIESTKPKLVLPVHFWIPYSSLPLDPLDKFLNISKARKYRAESRTLKISYNELPDKTTVIIMPPPTISENNSRE